MKPPWRQVGQSLAEEVEHGVLADREDQRVEADLELGTGDVVGNLAARGVPRAAVLGPGARHARQGAVLDAQTDRARQLHDLDALVPDGMDLLRVGRHLVDRPAVDQGDGRGADAPRRAHAVHGGVAGPHDAHAGADRDRPALPHAPQEGHAVDHAAGVLARQAESLRQLGAHRDEDGSEPGRAQLVEREVDAGTLPVPDLDAQALEDSRGPGRSAPAATGSWGSPRRPCHRRTDAPRRS